MSTVRIKGDVTELRAIEKEIKRLQDLLKPLRQRKKEIENQILTFMQKTNNGLQGLKMNGVEIQAVEKKVRERVNKEDKEQNAIRLLQQSGVHNARKTYKDLQEAMKGQETVKPVLRMKEH